MNIINEGKNILRLNFSNNGINGKTQDVYPGGSYEIEEIAGALYISTIELNKENKKNG